MADEIVLSSPKEVNINVYRGDSGSFRITMTGPLGTPIDISGATWDGDIRLKATDPDAITSFDFVPVAGDTSSVDVLLPADKAELLSGKYVYDVEMREGDAVTTLVFGQLVAEADVSRP
jgi:hypothetical protein